MITIPESDFMDQIDANANTTIMLCLGALALGVIIGFYTSLWISKRIVRLNKASQEIARENVDQEIQPENIEDLDKLGQTFNEMSDQLQTSFDSLRQSEEINRAIVTAIPDLMIRAKGDGTSTNVISKDWVNGGYKARHIPLGPGGTSFQEVLPPDLAELRMHYIQQALATGELQSYEHRIIINGQLRDEEVRIMVSGEDEVLVIIRDITDRKQAEEALRQSEAINRTIVTAIPDLMFRVKGNGNYIDVIGKDQVKRDYGVKDVSFGCINVQEALPPDLAELRMYYIQQALTTGELQSYEHRIIINGEHRDEELRIMVSGEDEVLVIIRDITDRKQAEQALVESKTRYQQVVETQTDFILRSFPDTTITFANPSLCCALGLSLQELIGMKWIDFANPEDLEPRLQKIAGLNPDNPTFLAENRDLRVNGTISWTQWLNQGIFNLQGELVGIQSVGRDITDRKQAEEALRQSEAINRTIVTAIPDLMMRIKGNGNYIDVIGKDRVKRDYGVKDVSVGCINVQEALPPDLAELVMHDIQKALATDELQIHEHHIIINGEHRDEERRIMVSGEDEVLVIIRDITDRKQAEEALQQSEAQNRAILQAIPDIMFRVNAQEIYLGFVTSSTLQSFLATEILHNGVGKHLQEGIPPEVYQLHRQHLHLALETRKTQIYEQEVVIEGKTQQEEVRVVPIEDTDEALFMIRDITDRKLAEEALRLAEEKYRSIIENAVDGIFQTTPEGKYININPAYVRIFGYDSPTEMIEGITNISEQMYVDPQRRAEVQLLLETQGFVKEFEARAYRKDGSIIWAQLDARAVKDDNGNVLYYEGFLRDITDRKKAEEEIRLANVKLEARVYLRTAELSEEKEKSEKLLLNILPESIADRLKKTNELIADHFTETTILFADIVGFTSLSTRMEPLQLVKGLNYIFSAFDQMTEKYGLEKIKTIGDAYMVVGGLPISKPDHVEAIANMALEMQACMTEMGDIFGQSLQVRIGINTGEVIAGVIGTKKFIYDLWGDAVNVASRMESHGKPGQIQVTDATYERLKEKYILEQRGVVEMKGCGNMMTYWLMESK